MQLFENEIPLNILPADGEVFYYPKVFSADEADGYFKLLMKGIEWKNDEVIIYGKHIITKRKVAWYGDEDLSYKYSGITKNALRWTDFLLELKKVAEEKTGAKFNSCLLNLYHNGDEGMAWHSDDEKMLEQNASIASISFGAARKFSLKHKQTKETVNIILETGSLLDMKAPTQTHWLHSLPKTTLVKTPRINLTFRKIIV
jgi:alkylated DNA repair dioxygenase AlkB